MFSKLRSSLESREVVVGRGEGWGNGESLVKGTDFQL